MSMEVASLVLGAIGTVTGIGALVWQVITWKHTGPVVTVTGDVPIPYVGKTGVVRITAFNDGRSPVWIASCGLQDLNGELFFPGEPLQGSDELPYRLENGARGRWLINVPQSMDTLPLRMRVYVRLANDKTVADKHPGLRYG